MASLEVVMGGVGGQIVTETYVVHYCVHFIQSWEVVIGRVVCWQGGEQLNIRTCRQACVSRVCCLAFNEGEN
jgi:hypothetical protein